MSSINTSNMNLLAFDDMVYDVISNEFREYQPGECRTVTCGRNAPVTENFDDEKEVRELLLSIFNHEEMVDYWLTITGLSLFGNKQKVMYLHQGTGSNGKTLLSDLVRKCFGKYFVNTSSITDVNNARWMNIPEMILVKPTINSIISSMDEMEDITFTPHIHRNIDLNNVRECIPSKLKSLVIINYPNKFVYSKSELGPINVKIADPTISHRINNPFFLNAFTRLILKYAHINIQTGSHCPPKSNNIMYINHIITYTGSEYMNNLVKSIEKRPDNFEPTIKASLEGEVSFYIEVINRPISLRIPNVLFDFSFENGFSSIGLFNQTVTPDMEITNEIKEIYKIEIDHIPLVDCIGKDDPESVEIVETAQMLHHNMDLIIDNLKRKNRSFNGVLLPKDVHLSLLQTALSVCDIAN